MPAIPKLKGAATTTRVSVIPPYVTVQGSALEKIKALTELSKTTPLQVVSIHDSNGTAGVFMSGQWKRDSFARLLDQSLAWMRGNTTSVTEAVLGPQTQVIKMSTMGNAKANSPDDTPWHPNRRKWIGAMRTSLGPYGIPFKTFGGATFFTDPATNGRWMGFLVNRTSTGEDWERNMDRVACLHFGRGNVGQPIDVVVGNSITAEGVTATGTDYTGIYTSFTLSIHDVSAIDFSTIPTTGWNESNAACISIKAAVDAVGATASLTIDPKFGGGAPQPGFMSSWLSGMTANKTWLVKLSVADGATNMGAILEGIVLNNSTITGGVNVWDMAYSGNALLHCRWKGYNSTTGAADPTYGNDPGEFITDSFVRTDICSKILMRGENSYGAITNYSNKTAWANMVHNTPGLHAVVINCYVNDINGTDMPIVFYKYACDLIQQVSRVNSGAVVIFNLPPCPGYSGGDNVRDNWFTGLGGVRARDSEFRDQIKAACATFPNNSVVIDYQAKYGNVAPTVLKGRIGQFGSFKRDTGDPIDTNHFKSSTWQSPSAQDIGHLFSTWCYL
jgi:hypothetical protein